MNFFIAKSKNYYEAFDYLENDETVDGIISYMKIINNSNVRTIEREVITDFPDLNFFIKLGKMPKNILLVGGWFTRGILMNKNLLSKLTDIKLPKHIVNPVKIYYRKKWVEDFVHIYFLENCIKYCDWERSTFYDDREKEILFNVNDIEELEHLIQDQEVKSISIKECKFDDSFPNYDLFGLFLADRPIYFSERLKQKLKELKVNDIQFFEPKVIIE